MTMHVRKLERQGLFLAKELNNGIQKLCSLAIDYLEIDFLKVLAMNENIEIVIPVGHYTDFTYHLHAA